MKEQKCRTCGTQLDANQDIAETPREPRKGDLSLCFYCGTLSLFNEELNLTPVTTEQLAEFQKSDPDLFNQVTRASLKIKFLKNHEN